MKDKILKYCDKIGDHISIGVVTILLVVLVIGLAIGFVMLLALPVKGILLLLGIPQTIPYYAVGIFTLLSFFYLIGKIVGYFLEEDNETTEIQEERSNEIDVDKLIEDMRGFDKEEE